MPFFSEIKKPQRNRQYTLYQMSVERAERCLVGTQRGRLNAVTSFINDNKRGDLFEGMPSEFLVGSLYQACSDGETDEKTREWLRGFNCRLDSDTDLSEKAGERQKTGVAAASEPEPEPEPEVKPASSP